VVPSRDLATLSLLDPEQGVCPNGHPCRLDPSAVGRRRCEAGEYTGLALICWDVTEEAIASAAAAGADGMVVEWAFLGLGNPQDRPT
jgi:hypothetical protein